MLKEINNLKNYKNKIKIVVNAKYFENIIYFFIILNLIKYLIIK